MANYDYLESDIMFPEHGYRDNEGGGGGSRGGYNDLIWLSQMRSADVDHNKNKNKNQNQKNKINYSSLPICIPEHDHFEWIDEFEMEERCGREREVVPPHLIMARRVAGNMEFSVCSGKGRTLKGRDLKEVRNEILKMTGFLEAN